MYCKINCYSFPYIEHNIIILNVKKQSKITSNSDPYTRDIQTSLYNIYNVIKEDLKHLEIAMVQSFLV